MIDPFHAFINQKKSSPPPAKNHGERKHSKFSASGADRWFNCPGSVGLSEGIKDKPNRWSEEGAKAHEVLEALLRVELSGNSSAVIEENRHLLAYGPEFGPFNFHEIMAHAKKTAKFILSLGNEGQKLLVETRISLSFIHPEAFGTFDGAAIEPFGVLDVVDFKYGANHAVAPKKNLQMIFYAMALAHQYNWNFETVKLWIDQPRSRGYDGPAFWELSIGELKAWVPVFEEKVANVEFNPDTYVDGPWCYWCKAKTICPLKREKKLDEAKLIFEQSPIDIDVQEYE